MNTDEHRWEKIGMGVEEKMEPQMNADERR